MSETINVEAIFGENVFNDSVMKERLPKSVYKKLKQTIEDGSELDPTIADVVAHAMKDWAVDNGATHYTHWFQPLTGVTAEKHDSFIGNFDSQGKVLMDLSGKELIKGETDGSSFPSGGLRATFEARGYTAWDCTSPAFLKKDATGVTLCIPTAFCSYRGEALDKKTPLLRSMQAIDKEATRIFHLFGHTEVKRVTPSVGPEQEYFLIDRDKYLKRKDLIYTGRTLFGAMPPKGQEMDDHYYGVIRERIGSYMKELNEELWKLGVTAKTQHNEVAPGQHEIAPIFAPADAALDSNFLVMDVLKSTATKHGLACLLHEKPFAGVNGSGKHNNWSLGTDNGVNLFKPGKEPNKNLQFLLVLACLMEAVKKHSLLLRAAASNTGNDHRLGANEAPPAIISIYMGDQLGEIVDAIVAGVPFEKLPCATVETLDLGVSTLPVLPKDPTDRNRTSPFAFTGNRFEFRMVASSVSIGDANTVMNSMMAESFNKACDALEGAEDFEKAAIDYIYKTMKENKDIVFNGNGYSDEWVEEAAKRGLPNVKSIVDAIPAYVEPSTIEMFEKLGVLSARELEARKEIKLEEYAGLINIEARTMIDMASKLYIPSVIAFVNSVASSMNTVKSAYAQADTSAQQTILVRASSLLADAQKALDELKKVTDAAETAKEYHDTVLPAMAALRAPIDELETIVDSEYWPVPTYGELMFEV